MTNPANFYEADEPAWLDHTVRLVADGRWAEIDAESLIDYLESGVRLARQEVRGRLLVLLQARLKWDFLPDSRVKGVGRVLLAQSHGLQMCLECPSLRQHALDILTDTFRFARELTGYEAFPDEYVLPADCPYSLDDLLSTGVVFEPSQAAA